MQKYKEISVLNNGSFGSVSLVEHVDTGVKYAAKNISLDLSSWDDIRTEVHIHQKLSHHPQVVQLVDNFHNTESNCYTLILEFCSGGDLHDALAKGLKPSTQEVKKIMLQLIDVLDYCHSNRVYHRDLKPENIFLHESGVIKLGDWGLATHERDCSELELGSEQYMAPECFDTSIDFYDAEKADIWSLGIVLLNLLFGRNPFKKANERDPLFRDFASSRETLYDIFPALTIDVFNVLRHSLTINPANRNLKQMRRAILNVDTWTTTEEVEKLERKKKGIKPVGLHAQNYRRPSPKNIPITHKPFRVPTGVARSLNMPSTPWDRQKMFTPPTQNAFPKHRPSSIKRFNGFANGELEMLTEQNEEALESDSDEKFSENDLQNDDDDDELLVMGQMDDEFKIPTLIKTYSRK